MGKTFTWDAAYIPHIAVFAVFLLLFLLSGGGFGKTACLIREKWLRSQKISVRVLRTVLLIVFTGNLLGGFRTCLTVAEDTAKDGYLLRENPDGGSFTAELELHTAEGVSLADVEIDPRAYTPEECGRILDRAEEALPSAVFGEQDPAHVERDLALPSVLPGIPAEIEWDTDRYDLIDADGALAGNAGAEGEKLTLAARISAGNTERTVRLEAVIFPEKKTLEEELAESIRTAGREGERVELPAALGGEPVRYSLRGTGSGMFLTGVGLLFALFYAALSVQRQEQEKRGRRQLFSGIIRILPDVLRWICQRG